ncbi:hypothetical protein [Phascolarctobacterium faecium]|uniref:hypothetical protein n=1 Tax=Phascolarctobacterium faecium TaxID=33025 RepID=UPI003AEFFF4C
MKKVITFFITILFAVLSLNSIAFASVIINACDNTKFISEPIPVSEFGLNITPLLPLTGFTSNQNANNPNMYGEPRIGVACITGVKFSIKNETPNVIVISWKDSVISVDGEILGIPFIPGMKYANAGNPSATPNTVLPPGAIINTATYISKVNFSGRHWQIDGVPLLKDRSRIFNIYIATTSNGATNYINITTPGIKSTYI